MAYAFGQPVSLAVNITDATGAAANATTVVLTVTLPDGTTVTPSVSNPTTGSYTATYTPTQPGLHHVRWVATGTNASAYTDAFNVDPPTPTLLASLADVKDDLNETSTRYDARLQRYIEAASSQIAQVVGPITPTTFTEVHDGGGPFIMLRNIPVISVTSIVEYLSAQTPYTLTSQPLGSTVDNFGYSLSPLSGKVTRRSNAGTQMNFLGGRQSIAVTYQAGMTQIDPALYFAVVEDIRVLYQQSQGGSLPSIDGNPSGDVWSPVGTFPRLQAVLQGFARVPGIA